MSTLALYHTFSLSDIQHLGTIEEENSIILRVRPLKRIHLKGSKIQLHFLSPYSPNLNPIERLWKWMKETVVYNSTQIFMSSVELFWDFSILDQVLILGAL